MPYIDSAGVKLNNNADLIIEAEASGAVTSCRDAVTGEEYVGGNTKIAHCTITNIGANAYIPVIFRDGYAIDIIARNATKNIDIPIFGSGLIMGEFEEDIEDATGDIEFKNGSWYLFGDATFKLNYE